MTTAMVSKKQQFRDLLSKFEPDLAEVLPSGFTAKRMAKIALAATGKDPKLLNCQPASFLECVMKSAECGLEFNTPEQKAYIIPYGNRAEFQISYRGLMDLAMRSGVVKQIYVELVYERDTFRITSGLRRDLQHELFLGKDRGAIIGVYAVAIFDGDVPPSWVWMPIEEVNEIRDKCSPSNQKGPWRDHYGEMVKKTAIKRLCKTLPSSVEDHRLWKAIEIDNAQERPDYARGANVVEVRATGVPQSDVLLGMLSGDDANASAVPEEDYSDPIPDDDPEPPKGEGRTEPKQIEGASDDALRILAALQSVDITVAMAEVYIGKPVPDWKGADVKALSKAVEGLSMGVPPEEVFDKKWPKMEEAEAALVG